MSVCPKCVSETKVKIALPSHKTQRDTKLPKKRNREYGRLDDIGKKLEEREKLDSQCREKVKRLTEYKNKLINWQKEHRQLVSQLRTQQHALLMEHRAAEKLLEQEKHRVETVISEGEKGTEKRQSLQEQLTSSYSTRKAAEAIKKIDDCDDEMEDWLHKCQVLLSGGNAVIHSFRVRLHFVCPAVHPLSPSTS